MVLHPYISYLQWRALDLLNAIPESKATESHLRAVKFSPNRNRERSSTRACYRSIVMDKILESSLDNAQLGIGFVVVDIGTSRDIVYRILRINHSHSHRVLVQEIQVLITSCRYLLYQEAENYTRGSLYAPAGHLT